ncbi:hypothetical protein H9Q13_03430 [Pontibacter sp. JH31]|uniref:Uncharacterized protein n=1 Tax=Pontibacter aquaedesilientis TaxID=2766980 RepID=A0ABR7XFQ7_9BACT|nr:hypothetical protein [Pontibacter aquaedesilientis]MBD1396206.1 hypothetical protein [Pontibacter aquaedesilientis]
MTDKRIDQLILFLPMLSAWLMARGLANDLMLMVLITAVLALIGFGLGYLLVRNLQGKQRHVRIVALIVVFVLVFALPLLVDTILTFYRAR